MRVLYYLPYPNGLGADYWIYHGWKYAFEDMGHNFEIATLKDDLKRRVEEFRPDIFLVANLDNILFTDSENMLWMRKKGVKVFLIVYWPLRPREVEILKNKDVADVYYGEREPESMQDFTRVTGRQYYLIPQAANKRWHFPAETSKECEYDILYIGAKLPKKRRLFEEVLLPLRKKYRVGIFGPYWTFSDNVMRVCQKICRKTGFRSGADIINRIRFKRIIPPVDIQRKLFASSKISFNFHEREPDGSQPHNILTQRTFVVPACGGFEICDYVPALRKYFTEDEMVMAKDKNDWYEKIDYYLRNDKKRRQIQIKGTQRALTEHTYHNRVARLFDVMKQCH